MAFSMLFLEDGGEQFNYSIYIAEDAEGNHPESWSESEKERIQLSFEFIMEGVRRLMTGEFDKAQETFH